MLQIHLRVRMYAKVCVWALIGLLWGRDRWNSSLLTLRNVVEKAKKGCNMGQKMPNFGGVASRMTCGAPL